MNINFGLFPPIAAPTKDETGKRLRGTEKSIARKHALTARAAADIDLWMNSLS